MKKNILYFILVLVICMASCSKKKTFSKDELTLIRGGAADTTFRILEVTNEQDLAILRKQSSDFNDFTAPDFKLFIERLKTTLINEDGVGIAAPQVGVLKNIFLVVRVDKQEEPIEAIINPKIISHSENTICFNDDGCLSIPDIVGNSMRYPWIEVEYQDINGNSIRERLEGYSRDDNFMSIIFQHEYDHLIGILFTDKLCVDEVE